MGKDGPLTFATRGISVRFRPLNCLLRVQFIFLH